ncbi:MAG: putative phenol hydroxylase [Chloroflexi bacterium]|nr:putative phenol hydroxylase [Chloroflexota bacterium]
MEGEVVADRHVRVERVALEDHRDVAILGGHVVDHTVTDPEGALGDVFQSGDHPEAGGLAAARRADQDHELAVLDLERQVADRGDLAVTLGDVVERDGGHDTPPTGPGIADPASCRAGRD